MPNCKKSNRELDIAKELLQEVVDAYDDTGCDGCGTIDVTVINKVLKFLGEDPLDTEY